MIESDEKMVEKMEMIENDEKMVEKVKMDGK
jgi:hypothetical protein